MSHTFFTLIIWGLACSQIAFSADKNTAKILDFDTAKQAPQKIKLSSVASSISYIPLETGDFTLQPGQSRVTTINGDYILAQDNKNLLLFSISGKQILNVGRAGLPNNNIPTEDIPHMYAYIDTMTRSVRCITMTRLYNYPMEGSPASSTDILAGLKQSGFVYFNITDIPQYQVYGKKAVVFTRNDSVYLSEDSGKSFPVIFRGIASCSYVFYSDKIGFLSPKWQMTKDHIAVFDYQTGSYNRLYYNGRKTTPYIFKFGKGFTTQVTDGQARISRLFETDKYLGIIFSHDETYDKFLYDKTSDKLIYLGELGEKIEPMFINDIDPGIDIITMEATEDNRLYGSIDAGKFKKMAEKSDNPKMRELAGRIKETDNPIVAIVRLK